MDPDKLHKLTDDVDRQHRAGMADVHRDFETAHFSVDDNDKDIDSDDDGGGRQLQ